MVESAQKMPALFIGHGSPMNALESSAYYPRWQEFAQKLPTPRAILCISAHWETFGTRITGAPQLQTIRDFYGFPPELFDISYAPPGDPALAKQISLMFKGEVAVDPQRGIDHGAWSVLRAMYPNADVPIVQLSLDQRAKPETHWKIAAALRPLRDQGILIVGSGNIVHNLSMVDFKNPAGFAWALRFNAAVKQKISSRNFQALINYPALSTDTLKAIPTQEHYLPLLYVLALADKDDAISFEFDELVMGSISMTSVLVGAN